LTVIVVSDTTLTATFEQDTFALLSNVEPPGSGLVTGVGRYACGSEVEVIAIANSGYTFSHWLIDGLFTLLNNPLTVLVVNDTTLTAIFTTDVIPGDPDTFNLFLEVEPIGSGIVTGGGRYSEGSVVVISALADSCYNFLYWRSGSHLISSENPLTFLISSDTLFTAIFEYICDTLLPTEVIFTISSLSHKSVDPRSQNYELPIYISINRDISDFILDKLVVEIDRNIFYPLQVSSGIFSQQVIGDILSLTISNISISALRADSAVILTKVIGSILLGDKDSSLISLGASLPDSFGLILIDGYITLDVCGEGNGRLLTSLGYDPFFTVKNNPITETLEVEGKLVELGAYSLEIVDLLGKSEIVKEWTLEIGSNMTFDYKIPIRNYGNGSYIIILNTPTEKYSQRFIIMR